MKQPDARKVFAAPNARSYLIGWFKVRLKGGHREAAELADRWLATHTRD